MDSICQIYDVRSVVVSSFLKDFHLEEYIDEHFYELSGLADDTLRQVFERRTGLIPKPLDRVFWFHLTRALPGTAFMEGLLPFGSSLDAVWDTIESVFSDTPHYDGLTSMRASNWAGPRYQLRHETPHLAGPYAMLVREVASYPLAVGNHDYLKMPETMQDICVAYMDRSGFDIEAELEQALEPRIVKFWSDRRVDLAYVATALLYLYAKVREQQPIPDANTCFDGQNVVIPLEQIVSVKAP